jgi:predicted small secreted protein
MNRLTSMLTRQPRLAWILATVVAIVVAACNNGSGTGY